MGLLFTQWLNMCIVVDILGVVLFWFLFFFFLEVLFRKVCPGVDNISVLFFFSFLCLSMNWIFLKRED